MEKVNEMVMSCLEDTRQPQSQTNPQHSIDLTTKSSSLDSVWLPKVLHGWELPWYRSPSSHRPKLPLLKKKEKNECLQTNKSKLKNGDMWPPLEVWKVIKKNTKGLSCTTTYSPAPTETLSALPLMKKRFSPVQGKHAKSGKKVKRKVSPVP